MDRERIAQIISNGIAEDLPSLEIADRLIAEMGEDKKEPLTRGDEMCTCGHPRCFHNIVDERCCRMYQGGDVCPCKKFVLAEDKPSEKEIEAGASRIRILTVIHDWNYSNTGQGLSSEQCQDLSDYLSDRLMGEDKPVCPKCKLHVNTCDCRKKKWEDIVKIKSTGYANETEYKINEIIDRVNGLGRLVTNNKKGE